VGAALVSRAKSKEWNFEWKVVTQLVRASNTTVILSREKNAKVVLEAVSDVPFIDVANADLSLRTVFDSASSEHWVTIRDPERALTPFCWMHELDRTFFGAPVGLSPFESAQSGAGAALAFRSLARDHFDEWRPSA
jgi:hypothetical protein